MIEVYLSEDIASFCEKVVAQYALDASDGTTKVPAVINGYQPLAQDNNDDVPCVIVRAISSTANTDLTTVNVAIIVTVFDEDRSQAGYTRVLEVITRIRNALMALKNGTLDDKLGKPRYLFVPTPSWENVSDQTYPYYQIQMVTSWQIRSTQPQVDYF